MPSQPEYIKGLSHTALVVIRRCKAAVIILNNKQIHNEESSL